MREMCLLDQNLPSDIMPLRDDMTVCGIAFTVKSAPHVIIQGKMTLRTQMLDDMRTEGLVVWDTSDDVEGSLWGGVMTATAIAKKLIGAVISGGIRDTKQILEQDFPTYRITRAVNYKCPTPAHKPWWIDEFKSQQPFYHLKHIK